MVLAHRSLARDTVCVSHAILREVVTESRQRPLGAFGHPSSRRTPDSNHDLWSNQIDVNKNIRWIFFCAVHAAAAQLSKPVINVGPHFKLILKKLLIMYYTELLIC